MNSIEEKCQKKGVRLTDQRRIIAQVMSDSKEKYGSKDHPDVDELHRQDSCCLTVIRIQRDGSVIIEIGSGDANAV